LTNTALSGARLYWEHWRRKLSYFTPKGVSIPVAVSVFPDEVYPAPRSWAERAYPKLIYYNKVDKGGHFAAWEQPQLFSEEIRAGFRSWR
jgi:pimeloyl-ACP methyl ester carboxylesterase